MSDLDNEKDDDKRDELLRRLGMTPSLLDNPIKRWGEGTEQE